MESVQWCSWMLQSSGLLSSVSYTENSQANQNAMKMEQKQLLQYFPCCISLKGVSEWTSLYICCSLHLYFSTDKVHDEQYICNFESYCGHKTVVLEGLWKKKKGGGDLVWGPPLLFHVNLNTVVTMFLRFDRWAALQENISKKHTKEHGGSIRLSVTVTGCGMGEFLEWAWVLAWPVSWFTSLELASNCLSRLMPEHPWLGKSCSPWQEWFPEGRSLNPWKCLC